MYILLWIISRDGDPDLTCNNGFIKSFSSWTKYIPESTNSSIKWWFIISNFIPTYLEYKYIFSSFRFQVGSRVGSGSVEKKFRILILVISTPSSKIKYSLQKHLAFRRNKKRHILLAKRTLSWNITLWWKAYVRA